MDPLADMLAQVRNGAQVKMSHVDVPYSKLKEGVAKILKAKEFIENCETLSRMNKKYLRIRLKYDAKKRSKFSKLQKISKPGRRVYVSSDRIPRPLSGFGIAILSTNKGILSGEEAKEQKVGGEVLCYVW